MKIAFVLTQSLDSPSGLGRYGPLAREMANLGHDMSILALHPAWDTLPQKQYRDHNVAINYVSQMHVRKEGSLKLYYSPGKLLLVTFLAIARLANAIAHSPAEIIQLCKPHPMNIIAAKLARRGRPIYCDCDDYEAETNRFSKPWQKNLVRYYEDDIVNFVKGITINTQFSYERYRALGFPASQMIYVPNGIEPTRLSEKNDVTQLRTQLQIQPDTPIVLYLGTLGLLSHPINLLLEAFVKVLNVVPQAKLMLVGGGEDYDFLQEESKRLGIASHTLFTGRVSPDQVSDYYQMATVSIDPVYDDLIAKARSPLKVVESLAVGTPVITGDVGDRRTMLADGELGFLVKAGDVDALADGIITILQDAPLRQKMSSAALSRRSQWFWGKLVHDFEQIYSLG